MDFEPRVKKVRLSSRWLFFTENRANAEFWKLTKFWMNILFRFRALLEQKQTSLVHLFTETRLLDRATTRNLISHSISSSLFAFFYLPFFRSHAMIFSTCITHGSRLVQRWKIVEIDHANGLTFDCIFNMAGIAPFPWPLEDGNCCSDLKDFERGNLNNYFCGEKSELTDRMRDTFGRWASFTNQVYDFKDSLCI